MYLPALSVKWDQGLNKFLSKSVSERSGRYGWLVLSLSPGRVVRGVLGFALDLDLVIAARQLM